MSNINVEAHDEFMEVQETREDSTFAPGTKIRYNPDLIETLKRNHQACWELYGQIKAAAKSDDRPLIQQKLKEFRISFMQHILTENVSLYVYLTKFYGDDKSTVDLVKKTRSEMDKVGKTVRAFMQKYETMDVEDSMFATFSEGLESVIQELDKRIATVEKSIYPLYSQKI